jgi:hypothetical protein
MDRLGGQGSRQRITLQIEVLRATLSQEHTGDADVVVGLTAEQLEQLAAVGGGTLSCVLLSLSPQEPGASGRVADDPRRDEQMMSVAVRLVAPLVRKSDVMVRAGGRELVCLLPGTGPLEARTVGRRLAAGATDQPFWVNDVRHTLHVAVGLAARTGPGDLQALVEVARRNRLV